MKQYIEKVGRVSINTIEEVGYAIVLLMESVYWILLGKFNNQPVKLPLIFMQAVQIGVTAIPIVVVLCFSVGMMLAMQGLETLKPYGAQTQVVNGIAISVCREFAALIVGIIVAGRSGSAIAARIGTMNESQELDALQVIGIDPVRYLAAPALLAMIISMPVLTLLGDLMGMLGGAVYTLYELGMPLDIYMSRSFEAINVFDLMQGLIKSIVFSILIVIVSVVNGFQVKGGAEGVGLATTRSVVMSISAIVVADMIFTFLLTRL
ncbi:Putative ABC transport system permease protein [hydrothermal vent metagenome]|uniref:ABC transport system permease protein n=1 Tax=hydrothermal vent metagenome TaxID=652676 RepID=A0A3B0XQM7_9ZZZZ